MFYLFIYLWLHWVLIVARGIFVAACRLLHCGMWTQLQHACGIQFPNQGSNPGPLHWVHGVLPTGPPGKSLHSIIYQLCYFISLFSHVKYDDINGRIKLINMVCVKLENSAWHMFDAIHICHHSKNNRKTGQLSGKRVTSSGLSFKTITLVSVQKMDCREAKILIGLASQNCCSSLGEIWKRMVEGW